MKIITTSRYQQVAVSPELDTSRALEPNPNIRLIFSFCVVVEAVTEAPTLLSKSRNPDGSSPTLIE